MKGFSLLLGLALLLAIGTCLGDDFKGNRVRRQFGALRPSLGGDANYDPYNTNTGTIPPNNNNYNQNQNRQPGYNRRYCVYVGGGNGYGRRRVRCFNNQGQYNNNNNDGYNYNNNNYGFNGGYETGISGGLDYNNGVGGGGYGR